MRAIYLLIAFLFLSVPGQAYDGLFKILDERYINSITDLPEAITLRPAITWQSSGNIRAWIDIVGFRDMIRDNGINYVPGNPADHAIVRYDVQIDELKSRVVTDYRVRCYWCAVTGVNKRVEIRQKGNMTVARLYVSLSWHETVENSGTSTTLSYTDTAVFEDTEIAPLIYNKTIDDITADITEYNNTFAPKTVIYLPNAPNIIKVTYSYQGDELTHYRKLAHVERTEKGVMFANLTEADFWTENTNNLHHMNQWAILPNTSSPDYDSLKITASNLYESKVLENKSISRMTYRPETTFSNPLIVFVMTILTFIIMSAEALK